MEETKAYTDEQLEVMRDFFSEEEIAEMARLNRPYPFAE
jgi:hypothetical protein